MLTLRARGFVPLYGLIFLNYSRIKVVFQKLEKDW